MSEETIEIVIEALSDYRMWFEYDGRDDELSEIKNELSEIKLRQIEEALEEINKLK